MARKGSCPEDLKLAFGSISIAWLFGSMEQEILTLTVHDDIEQHNRRRHTELENVLQAMSWMEGMKSIQVVDHTKAIDIVKFGLAQGDPLKP